MSSTTSQTPSSTPSSDPTQPTQPQGPTTGPIYLYAFTLIAFLICIFACCSAWRGVAIRRRRRAMGLPELEEWGMGNHDAFGRGLREAQIPDPPVMYEVYLEGDKAEAGRWYRAQEKGRVDNGVWSNNMPISTSLVPISDRSSPETQADPTLGITIFSALTELSPHRWNIARRLRSPRRKTAPTSSPKSVDAPAKPPASPPRKVVTSVLIAMPTPHHSHGERQPSTAMSEGTLVFEDELPELLFGVYEGAWAHQPAQVPSPSPLAPTPNNDVASRV